jgi:glutamine synthetase adenylyltransferase
LARRSLLGLEPVQDLVDDLTDGHLARAERDVEVLRLLEPRLADHLRQHGRADELLVRQALLLEPLLERLATLPLGLLARLAGEPLADLVARA